MQAGCWGFTSKTLRIEFGKEGRDRLPTKTSASRDRCSKRTSTLGNCNPTLHALALSILQN